MRTIMPKLIFFIFIIICLGGIGVYASSINFSVQINKSPCAEQLKKQLTSKIMRQTWVPKASAEPGRRMVPGIQFRDTKSKKAYRIWSNNDVTKLSEVDTASGQIILKSWSKSKSCQVVTEAKKINFPSLPKTAGFSDDDLNKILSANSWGVIYVWTPVMPLSVEGLKEIKDAVNRRGGHLTILVDANASSADTTKWVEKGLVANTETTPVAAQELFERDIGLHYPVAYIYKDGFLSNREYLGYKSKKIYNKWIDLELAALDKDLK